MKKLSLVVACLLSVWLSYGQQASDTTSKVVNPKPTKGHWGVSFDVGGLINNISLGAIEDANGNNSILLRRYITDEYVVRAGFGLNSTNRTFDEVDSVGTTEVTTDSSFRKTDFFFAPGIEKHFLGSKRLDPYVGGIMEFGILGGQKIKNNVSVEDTIGVSTTNFDSQFDGGFSFGVKVLAGFNYFFSDKFSLGAEYRLGYNYIREGGDFSTVIIETPVSGSPSTTRLVGSRRTTNGGFQVDGSAGITLSYFFTRNKSRK